MKRFRLPLIMGLIMIFSVMPAFAGSPSVTSVVSSLPNLTGGRPLKDISTVDPTLTQDTMLINKLNDPDHLPKFVVSDPYGTLSKVPSSHPQNTADNGGEIMGTKDEVVYLGDNASLAETTAKAKENYKFTTWTADRDITLNDGTVIAAGTEMSKEQVELSVVDRETTFTAHFIKNLGSLRIIKESN